MDQIKLEELAVAYPDQEDLVQVYKEWGDSAYLQDIQQKLCRPTSQFLFFIPIRLVTV